MHVLAFILETGNDGNIIMQLQIPIMIIFEILFYIQNNFVMAQLAIHMVVIICGHRNYAAAFFTTKWG